MMVPKMLILALFLGSACAATSMGLLPMKPQEFNEKVGCYIREINDVIEFGESITPLGYCYRISCHETFIDYASCGVVLSSDPRCHKIDRDLSKPYPNCCPLYRCGLVGTDDPKCYKIEEDTSKPYPSCCADIKCDLDNNII